MTLAGSPLLSWDALQQQAAPEHDRIEGPTNAQARLRLFGQPEAAVRVTLYRDHHAWCPYCQKVWLWLEEQRIPYRIRKVTMFCYGEKEGWYRRLVPSGMLPALEIDGVLITESDRILEALEAVFGVLGAGLHDPQVLPLRQLERLLFRAWCQWLCSPGTGEAHERRGRDGFRRVAGAMEEALMRHPGPFLLDSFSAADVVFVPYVERMSASLLYYKAYNLRQEHPAIDRWFRGLEARSTYRGTQSDFHTHVHDLPPQMGGCTASGTPEQRRIAARINEGPWPIAPQDPETSEPAPEGAAAEALGRVLRHRRTLVQRNPLGPAFEPALQAALTGLIRGEVCVPPPGTAAGLRYLRDRICVPRDLSLHAARQLRAALEATAQADPLGSGSPPPPLRPDHRRDQDPRPFLATAGP
ncbi:MAG: glutathione S-transferase family protein [Prochlorococcaceae cyanobacterium]|jgi:glutathione S-transferase